MKYSVELLYHFTCKECKCWWSIAVTRHIHQVVLPWKTPLQCPYCGTKQ